MCIANDPHLIFGDKTPPPNSGEGNTLSPHPHMANTFVTLKSFAQVHSATSLDIIDNESTGKRFASINGMAMKCQQDIDKNKPMVILVEEDGDIANLNDCCLINAVQNIVATISLI